MDWTVFWTIFWTILKGGRGGKHTINTEGGVGYSLSVLREGWEAECYYSGRGERRTISNSDYAARVGGGCNNEHYWLMELSLDRKNYFNWFSTDFLYVI